MTRISDADNAARSFALQAHGAQKYGDQPYAVHLDAVASILAEFGVTDEVILQAAYLHDVLEDTNVKEAELTFRFGPEVARIVHAVTTESGPDRAARHALTYPKIARNRDAITLKLADRIANMRASVGHPKMPMYREEYPGFRSALFTGDPTHAPMWRELDGLASGSPAIPDRG